MYAYIKNVLIAFDQLANALIGRMRVCRAGLGGNTARASGSGQSG